MYKICSGKEIEIKGNKLYVQNLSHSVNNDELKELFSNYGKVSKVNVIEGRHFGFVEMSNPADAKIAKESLDGYQFKGLTLRVDEAEPPGNKRKRHYRR